MPAYVQNKAEAQFVFGAMVTLVENDRQYMYVHTYIHFFSLDVNKKYCTEKH
jgi:hypothetical protein